MMRWTHKSSILHVLFFSGVLGFTSGIFVNSFFDFGFSDAGGIFLAGVALLTFFARRSTREHAYARAILSTAAVLMAGALGIIHFNFSDARLADMRAELAPLEGISITMTGIVVREPDVRASRTLLTVSPSLIAREGKTPAPVSPDARVLIFTDPYTDVSYGDTIRARGELARPRPFAGGEGREFDYEKYLSKDGITHTMLARDAQIVGRGSGNKIVAALLFVKGTFLSSMRKTLPEPDAGLLGGIIWGEKHGVPDDLTEDFRNSGLVHIIVLSGFNMTIVAAGVMWFLGRFPLRAKFSFGAGAIVAFAIAAGAGATVMRAAFMAILALVAKASGRPYAVPVSLSLAALLMLLWNPRVLLYDPSFQLSFIATLGLIYVSPIIERHLRLIPRAGGMRELAAATIGTQIAVLPLLLYMIGNLSLVSLPANLIALPVIPVVMLFGFLTAVAGLFGHLIAVPFAFFSHLLLSFVIGVARVFGSLPLAAIPVPAFHPSLVFLAYAFLIMLVIRYLRAHTSV